MRVSLILLKVDPSATTETWKAAEAEATAIEKRLREGADFAELAKLHSADQSAEQGGDLGYLHVGMLPDGIQEKLDAMKPGELSTATRILEGYAVFRYEALQAPKHHDFATVRQRASDLLAREQSEEAWKSFIADLRKKAKISINAQRYPMLAGAAAAAR
jgi:parvulin-like peptidyl-prolyl isomerase